MEEGKKAGVGVRKKGAGEGERRKKRGGGVVV